MSRKVSKIFADERGAMALFTAITLVGLLGFVGLAIDVGYWQMVQRNMQGAADQAAYSAALDAQNGSSSSYVTTQAKALAAASGFVDGTNQVTVSVNSPPTSGSYASSSTCGAGCAYEVIISQVQPMWFTRLFLSSAPTVTARAVGVPSTANGAGACVIALNGSVGGAVGLVGSTSVDISTCDVYANSTSASALSLSGGGIFKAKDAFIVGGESASNNTGLIVTGTNDCSNCSKHTSGPVADPYANRTAPTVGSCGSNPTSSTGGGNNGTYTTPNGATIYAGVYCGGITVGGPLTLKAKPDGNNVFVIKNGSFKVTGGSTGDPTMSSGVCSSSGNKPYINADGVTIYVIGSPGTYGIQEDSCFSVTAPAADSSTCASSPCNKGIAVWVDSTVSSTVKESFSASAKTYVQGAIYAPSQTVTYAGSTSATAQCTQIVADQVSFTGNANLTHNCTGVGVSDPVTNSGPVKIAE